MPRFPLRLLALLPLAFAVGCFGVAHNPGYFPNLIPGGDIIQTHAKPPGGAYYRDFDPKAKEQKREERKEQKKNDAERQKREDAPRDEPQQKRELPQKQDASPKGPPQQEMRKEQMAPKEGPKERPKAEPKAEPRAEPKAAPQKQEPAPQAPPQAPQRSASLVVAGDVFDSVFMMLLLSPSIREARCGALRS